jgi:hypothetical protein
MGDEDTSQKVQVLISPDEFAEDLDLRLGRANGNVYHRKEGIEGVHDGQVMVRLKKKRFVLLDYGIVPNEDDVQAAANNPHISVLDGAGVQKCVNPDCTKVGIPVLLYDSHPDEPASLYLRSGLCFVCQRHLNEKRRTQRKRKGDIFHPSQQEVYTLTSGQKKFKLNGDSIELSPDAIVINGPVDGAKHHGEGYGYSEIGPELQGILRDATTETERLIMEVSNASSGDPTSVAFAAAVAAAGESSPAEDAVDSVANAGVDAAASAEDISALYDKAFVSLSKGLFLLSQFKASWDAAVAAAVAQETVNDAGLADAVASAAAVVAAASEEQNTTNMVPLLLAAESKEHKKSEEAGEVFCV